jgi:DNA-binding transcriptional LysR family regulator
MAMTQKELVYVLAVAKEKSISKAAQKLFITQPSLSNAIKKIEEALGTKLFIRTNRGLKLTFSGERYCAIANDIIKIFEDFEIEISDINNLKKGRLHIGITAYISTYLLPKVLPKFKQAAPNIDFTFIELTSVELEKELKEGLIDFAIMPTAGIPDLQPEGV